MSYEAKLNGAGVCVFVLSATVYAAGCDMKNNLSTTWIALQGRACEVFALTPGFNLQHTACFRWEL